jgi:hypothetical protein
VLVLATVFVSISCKDEAPAPNNPNDSVNSWILENMRFYYYWTNDIPAAPTKTLTPDLFFESLLSNEDRFSWIQENFQELLNSLRGVNKEAGYEFVLYLDGNAPGNVIAQVLYVKPNSPASGTALKRGDVITKINGQTITEQNYRTLLSQIGEPHTLEYRPINIESGTFGAATPLQLNTVEFAENPNFYHTVFTQFPDHKIGYYVYNFFGTGPTEGSTVYNTEMDQIFTNFKSAGITDLIVDLRFNSGGSETATRNLASLIVKNATTSDIFVKRQYNEGLTQAIINDPALGPGFLEVKFTNKAQNVGSQLQRVFILTGSRTASASELLINGLRPFMEVFLIGNQTVGKNVGSISLYEENEPRNTWGMQPIVVKSFNKLNQSDYGNGFVPNRFDEDNRLWIFPLGDTRERLLNLALNEITGLQIAGRSAERDLTTRAAIATSLDHKPIRNQLTVDGEAGEALRQLLMRQP